MTKLFRIACVMTYCVVAENTEEAKRNAVKYAKEHLKDAVDPLDLVTVFEISETDDIPPNWEYAIPYGGEGEDMVYQYLPI